MTRLETLCRDYERVEEAIRFLEACAPERPSLSAVAEQIGLSQFHLQRLFSRWVGISPKRFLQFLTHAHARKMIERSDSLLAAAYEAGLSGPGRLHDLFVSCEAVTPGHGHLSIRALAVPSPTAAPNTTAIAATCQVFINVPHSQKELPAFPEQSSFSVPYKFNLSIAPALGQIARA